MTQPTAEQLEVTQADVTAALPTESELKLARECTARANFLLEEKTLQSILNGEQDTWPEIVASILAIRATEARMAEAVEAERERANKAVRVATDRQYMIDALVNMLGPNALQVWKGWQESGTIRVHWSWGPKAAEMTGEERAAAILEWTAAAKNGVLIEDVDRYIEQIDVRRMDSETEDEWIARLKGAAIRSQSNG